MMTRVEKLTYMAMRNIEKVPGRSQLQFDASNPDTAEVLNRFMQEVHAGGQEYWADHPPAILSSTQVRSFIRQNRLTFDVNSGRNPDGKKKSWRLMFKPQGNIAVPLIQEHRPVINRLVHPAVPLIHQDFVAPMAGP